MNQPLITSNNKGEAIQATDFNDMVIRYRFYQPEDSPSMIALENESSQFPTLLGLVNGGTVFRDVYETKSSKFKDYIILVAEAEHKAGNRLIEICGGVCLGLKDMYFGGSMKKSGVLYDLRVSDRYRIKSVQIIRKCCEEKRMRIYILERKQNQRKSDFSV